MRSPFQEPYTTPSDPKSTSHGQAPTPKPKIQLVVRSKEEYQAAMSDPKKKLELLKKRFKDK